jgi:hypothetical protein
MDRTGEMSPVGRHDKEEPAALPHSTARRGVGDAVRLLFMNRLLGNERGRASTWGKSRPYRALPDGVFEGETPPAGLADR